MASDTESDSSFDTAYRAAVALLSPIVAASDNALTNDITVDFDSPIDRLSARDCVKELPPDAGAFCAAPKLTYEVDVVFVIKEGYPCSVPLLFF